MATNTSIYFEKLRQNFLSAYERREEQERILTPENFDDFSAADEACTNAAVKFLEAGATARVEGGLVIINADERECEVYRDKIVEVMGKDEFFDFFPELAESKVIDVEDEDETSDENTEDSETNATEEAENVKADTPPTPPNPFADPQLMQNPFYAMMQFFASFMPGAPQMPQTPQIEAESTTPEQPAPKKNETILESTISDIKGKTERLEKEKSDAIKSFKVVLEKSKRLEYELSKRLNAQKEAEDRLNEAVAEKDAAVKALDNETGVRERLHEEIEQLKCNLNEVKTSSEKALNELRSKSQAEFDNVVKQSNDKISGLEQQIKSKTDQIKNKDDQISGMKKNISDLQNNVNDLKNQLTKAQNEAKEVETLRKQLDEANKKSDEAKKTIDSLNADINKLKTELDTAKKEVEKSAATLSESRTEKEKVMAELEALKLKSSEVNEGQIKSLNDEIERLKAQISEAEKKAAATSGATEKELEENKRLAFTDMQTGVLNSNAFNNDIRSYNIGEITMAQINIRGVRDINITYGKSVGDTLIKSVAKKVAETFPEDAIYRVLGDNFVIISKDSFENVDSKIKELKATLKKSDMEIIAVVCSGKEFSSIAEIVKECEKLINLQRKFGEAATEDETPEVKESVSTTSSGVEEVDDDDDYEDVDPEDEDFED